MEKIKEMEKRKEIAYEGNCPECNADWRGKLIPKKDRHLYSSDRYSRLIGIEIQGGYDGVSFWECPDCRSRWDRFTGEKVGNTTSQMKKRLRRN